MARLVAIAQGRFKPGVMKQELGDSAPDFLEPMAEDDVALREGGAGSSSCSTATRGPGARRRMRG